MIKVLENFLSYIKIETTSNEEVESCPSSACQLALVGILAKQCNEIGLKDVTVDENGYLYATIPETISEYNHTIGFIAHMDTSPDMSGKNVSAKIIENYNGDDITLNSEKKIILSPFEFPSLKDYIGDTLITTDGTTLLGADDKAGIAEIMAASEYLINHPEIKHGKIRIAFNPDEEIGRGADKFNVDFFKADFAYTIDGGSVGELEYENFNATQAKFHISGKNVHPGTAKNIMINSILVANELINMLPASETPSHTENYEGFYHITGLKGDVENTELNMIIRDFDLEGLKKRQELLKNIAAFLNLKYGNNVVELSLKEQYLNMIEKINEKKYVLELASSAMHELGIQPVIKPIRGGTDGARLSFMGLPCPNIFTGGHNFHGKYEYIPVSSMEKAVMLIVKIAELSVNLKTH